MKILHVITTINRGGAENHLADLASLQVRAGQEVCVAYLKETPYWKARLEGAGVQVRDLGMRRYGDLRSFLRLRKLLVDFRPDLLHAHMPPAETYARMALFGIPRRRIPLIISKHNDEPFFKGLGEGWMSRWTASRADRIIAISGAVREYLLSKGILRDPRKVEVIHYGIDPAPFSTAEKQRSDVRRQLGVEPGTYLIGTVARMVPQKALHVLLEGFALYSATSYVQTKLVLVGRGPLEPELRVRASELGIEGKVVFAGFREDIPAVMQAFDIFALSSIYEGFGLVLLEAMAASKPVVASRVSAIPEVVDHGLTGLLVEPDRAGGFAEAFCFFADDGTRARYGSEGLGRVMGRFTLEAMLEATLSVYQRAGGKLSAAGGSQEYSVPPLSSVQATGKGA